ncbi:ubiquitin-like domain-containing protein [Paenibacillus sp. FSL M7-0831]|uniref:ubiquitin-like domain-containing protein n=1 Tax=Paenibacillus sp. FSL M7-0831 TaxID=2975314 RepID=UPI0030F540EB
MIQKSQHVLRLRWKHENLRQISTAAIVTIAVTIMILLLVNSSTRKQVYLVVDGQVKKIQTHKSVLQEMLDEQAISLKPEDQVSMPLSGSLQNGDKVVIDRAAPRSIDGGRGNEKVVYHQRHGWRRIEGVRRIAQRTR